MSLEVAIERCTSCGLCVERCPLDCLRLDERELPVLKYAECWYCGACEVECPEKALTVQLPFLIR
ncbi:MAG: 4Fe-4S binding protein [Chloroflexi bacterium]|nr:4Fe-4S binding protein [Chloroflexota bacterium]MCL5075258.1 4Fe-4S binding protein [Chloroflexota bacterium]